MTHGDADNNGIPLPDLQGAGIETLGVRGGQRRSAELEHSEAIFATSSFVYNSAAQAAARDLLVMNPATSIRASRIRQWPHLKIVLPHSKAASGQSRQPRAWPRYWRR